MKELGTIVSSLISQNQNIKWENYLNILKFCDLKNGLLSSETNFKNIVDLIGVMFVAKYSYCCVCVSEKKPKKSLQSAICGS